MEGGLFGALDGISPWVWIGLGLALAGAELLLGSYFLLWPGAAAVLTGLALTAAPGLSGATQVVAFAVLAAGLTAGARAVNLRLRGEQASDDPTLNRRGQRMIGRRGRVLEPFAGGEGVVEVDGLRWRARLVAGAQVPDQTVRVQAVEGSVLLVLPE